MRKKKVKTTETPSENIGTHWIAMKRKEFLAGLDDSGNPIHVTEEKDALKFEFFSDAMPYFKLGYSILKIN